jgi:hypothetical protein
LFNVQIQVFSISITSNLPHFFEIFKILSSSYLEICDMLLLIMITSTVQ